MAVDTVYESELWFLIERELKVIVTFPGTSQYEGE